MFKRIFIWGSVVFALISFIFILNSGSYLKKPLHPNEDILGYLVLINTDIQSGNWGAARCNYDRLAYAWNIIKKRVSFSSEHDQVERFQERLDQLGVSIDLKDPLTALRDVAILKKTFLDFK